MFQVIEHRKTACETRQPDGTIVQYIKADNEKHLYSSTCFILNIMFFGKQLFALVAASVFTVSSALGEYQNLRLPLFFWALNKRRKKNWLIASKSRSQERLKYVSRS